jgi:hypothetical protein
VSGYHVAFAAAASMLGVGGLIMALALRQRHVRAIDTQVLPAAAGA